MEKNYSENGLEYFPIQGKKIFIAYKNYNIGQSLSESENDEKGENNLILKFDSDNKVSIFYPEYVEVAEYTVDEISKNVFFLNWNEKHSGLFVNMFQNTKNNEVNLIRFNVITREILTSWGRFIILDEKIFSMKKKNTNEKYVNHEGKKVISEEELSSMKNKLLENKEVSETKLLNKVPENKEVSETKLPEHKILENKVLEIKVPEKKESENDVMDTKDSKSLEVQDVVATATLVKNSISSSSSPSSPSANILPLPLNMGKKAGRKTKADLNLEEIK